MEILQSCTEPSIWCLTYTEHNVLVVCSSSKQEYYLCSECILLAAIIGATKLAPTHLVTSLQLIWNLGTSRFHSLVWYPIFKWVAVTGQWPQTTRMIVPKMATCPQPPPLLTHWGRDKMADIFQSQTTLSNAFSWMKMFKFLLRFHWILFLRVQLTIFQHWFS